MGNAGLIPEADISSGESNHIRNLEHVLWSVLEFQGAEHSAHCDPVCPIPKRSVVVNTQSGSNAFRITRQVTGAT